MFAGNPATEAFVEALVAELGGDVEFVVVGVARDVLRHPGRRRPAGPRLPDRRRAGRDLGARPRARGGDAGALERRRPRGDAGRADQAGG